MSANIFLPSYILKPLAVLAAAGVTSIAVMSFKAGAAVGRRHPNTPKDVTSLLAAAATDKVAEHAANLVKKGSGKVNKHVAAFVTTVVAKRTGLPKDVIAKIPNLIDEVAQRFTKTKAEQYPATSDVETERKLHITDLANVTVEELQNSENFTVIDSDLLARETDDYITQITEEALSGTETPAAALEAELLPNEFLDTTSSEDEEIINEILDQLIDDEKATENSDNADKKKPSEAYEETITVIKDKLTSAASKENIDNVVDFVSKNEEKIVDFFKNFKNKKE